MRTKKQTSRKSDRLERCCRNWASWMQIQSEKLSLTAKKAILVVFCLLIGVYLTTVMLGALGLSALPDSGRIVRPHLMERESRSLLLDSTESITVSDSVKQVE